MVRSFSEMTHDEMHDFQNRLQSSAIEFAKERGFSGLSHAGCFNFYTAIQKAIEREWMKAAAVGR